MSEILDPHTSKKIKDFWGKEAESGHIDVTNMYESMIQAWMQRALSAEKMLGDLLNDLDSKDMRQSAKILLRGKPAGTSLLKK